MRARSSKGRMAQRGRGTLEVRESNNPFFQTTNKNIGMDLARNRPFDAPRFARPVPRDANDGFDFRFQYEQSSTKIGQGVHHSDSRISHTLMRCDAPGDVARAKGAGLYPTEPDANASDAALATTVPSRKRQYVSTRAMSMKPEPCTVTTVPPDDGPDGTSRLSTVALW